VSTGRWVGGAIPLVFAMFWVGLYGFSLLSARRDQSEELKPAELHF